MSELSELVNRLLRYDPRTGDFEWKCSNNWKNCSSRKAGSLQSNGYIVIRINKKLYLAHRLAWLICYGRTPKEIDHINRKKNDNRLINLREVSHSENCKNCANRVGAFNV